jgi:ubiquinone/menaquinone biosynthesis C-methylase UbiE
MKAEKRRDFDNEAVQWDQNLGRIKLATDVAGAIIQAINPVKDMDVLDFGCGTGLITLHLQPYVGSIVGADSSKGMLSVLEGKVKQRGLTNVSTQLVDFEKGERVAGTYSLIVSSMTVHHVPDTGALFRLWHDLLKPDGRVCFADLDVEDGTFHTDTAGVFHFGFDREKLKALLRESGFSDIQDTTAATVVRDVEGMGEKKYPLFLIIGKR